jgi:hypothetical protein
MEAPRDDRAGDVPRDPREAPRDPRDLRDPREAGRDPRETRDPRMDPREYDDRRRMDYYYGYNRDQYLKR